MYEQETIKIEKSNRMIWFDIFILIALGIYGANQEKLLHNSKVDGFPDIKGAVNREFEHPWFMVLLMFIGEFLCLPFFYLMKIFKKNSKKEEIKKEMNTDDVKSGKFAKLLLAIISFIDLIGSVFFTIGNIWLDPSITSMLCRINIVFITFFSWLLLKRKLNKYNWAGISVVLVGVGVICVGIGLKAYYGKVSDDITKKSSVKMILGASFIILGSAIYAFKDVVEEMILGKSKLEPAEVVGIQGAYGIVFSIIALIIVNKIPGSYPTNQKMEDTLDAFKMLSNSPLHVAICVSEIILLAFFNLFSVRLTQKLSTIHKMFVGIIKNILLWTIEICLFYAFHSKVYGSRLDIYSTFKAAGFAISVFGAILYNRMPKKL